MHVEEEDTCKGPQAALLKDHFMSYEEDTCMSYEEEDTYLRW